MPRHAVPGGASTACVNAPATFVAKTEATLRLAKPRVQIAEAKLDPKAVPCSSDRFVGPAPEELRFSLDSGGAVQVSSHRFRGPSAVSGPPLAARI